MARSPRRAILPAVNPIRLTDLAVAYWDSSALLALNELGVFAALADGPAPAAALAETLGCDPRLLDLLLRAGVALELLEQVDEGYATGAEAAAFLVPGGSAFLGGALRYALDILPAWARLVDGVRTGRPQLEAESYLGDDPERTERYVRAMHGRALAMGRGVAAVLALPGRRRLLDVSGGSGAYSILLCQQTPGLSSTLCDLPAVLAVSSRLIGEAGLADCITTRAWDLNADELPPGHDVALVSGLLHRLPPAEARDVLARVHAALEPGGEIAVADVMLDATGAGPKLATLFALNMALTAPGGGAHRVDDHLAWLSEVGFSDARAVPLPPPAAHTVVRARRP